MEFEEITGRIIEAAIDVHRSLGPGFLEAIYEEALALELRAAGVNFSRQAEIRIQYLGQDVGVHRLDLLVESEIVVELKAVRSIEPIHYMVVRSYLRAAGKNHALILNFSSAPLEIRRVSTAEAFSPRPRTSSGRGMDGGASALLPAEPSAERSRPPDCRRPPCSE